MINIAKDGTGSERKEGWKKSRDQESYSDTYSAVYGHVRSKASRAKEGKKGSGRDCGRRSGEGEIHVGAYGRDGRSMLRRTYYGARQYLNTLDGKVVHEGEIGIPLCSGVRRVRARGWTERLLGRGGERRGRVDLHTRHEPLSQRDGTDWKPFIHSVALYFFPVFDWESIVDHPPLRRFSSLFAFPFSLSRSVPTGTLNYYFFPFFFLSLSLRSHSDNYFNFFTEKLWNIWIRTCQAGMVTNDVLEIDLTENEILSWRFDQAFENEDLEDGPPVRGNVIFDLIGKIKILF